MSHLGFWKKLKKPILVLAPMADVTDAAFRRMIAKYGKPDVLWTEFVSADGLFLSPLGEYCEKFIAREITRDELHDAVAKGVGGSHLLIDLLYTEAERPIVAQFFTSKPELMRKAALLSGKLGFDGVDINMGCPDKSIEKQGAGAALIKAPKLARELIRAAKEGARSTGSGQAGELPVSVKTRLGFNKDELETWLPELLAEEPAVITIHSRTRKEMSKVPARWERVKRAVEIRNELGKETLIFGNGDVLHVEDAKKKADATGADGVMLGRAIFGTPYLFSYSREYENKGDPETLKKILNIMVEHTKLYEELLGPHKNFAIMKKHYKAYVSGFDGAAELRGKLMEAKNATEVEEIAKAFLTKTSARV